MPPKYDPRFVQLLQYQVTDKDALSRDSRDDIGDLPGFSIPAPAGLFVEAPSYRHCRLVTDGSKYVEAEGLLRDWLKTEAPEIFYARTPRDCQRPDLAPEVISDAAKEEKAHLAALAPVWLFDSSVLQEEVSKHYASSGKVRRDVPCILVPGAGLQACMNRFSAKQKAKEDLEKAAAEEDTRLGADVFPTEGELGIWLEPQSRAGLVVHESSYLGLDPATGNYKVIAFDASHIPSYLVRPGRQQPTPLKLRDILRTAGLPRDERLMEQWRTMRGEATPKGLEAFDMGSPEGRSAIKTAKRLVAECDVLPKIGNTAPDPKQWKGWITQGLGIHPAIATKMGAACDVRGFFGELRGLSLEALLQRMMMPALVRAVLRTGFSMTVDVSPFKKCDESTVDACMLRIGYQRDAAAYVPRTKLVFVRVGPPFPVKP